MITKKQAEEEREFHETTTRGDGTCYVWRRNGKTKTWKTRPDEFIVPVKYGLRSYHHITEYNQDLFYPASDCPNCKQYEAAQKRRMDRKAVKR